MANTDEAGKLTVLIVDDEEGIRFGLTSILTRGGYKTYEAQRGTQALELVGSHEIDLVLLDIKLKETSGLDVLSDIRNLSPQTQIIIVTGYGTIQSAVEAMQKGACDYILKPVEKHHLLHAVERAISRKKIEDENYLLKKELLKKHTSVELVTEDPSMKELTAMADQVKNTDCNILITGETGVGKEVIAEYIHFTGSRRDKNFVTINCASLSEELLSSELFGHVKGSFTGAVDHKIGKCDLADGGTLFLDEIGEMPLSIQAKLLRVLEEKCFERVGGVKKVHVDIRLIAATNSDLERMVSKKQFRDDLFFRLLVIRLHVPPLRDRRCDILPLAEQFLSQYAQKYHKKITGLSPEAVSLLMKYTWPGNVRELQNFLHRAVLLSSGETITPHNLSCALKEPSQEMNHASGTLKDRLEPLVASYEYRIICETLQRNNGNKSKTADELGITRQTLLSKIRQLNIE